MCESIKKIKKAVIREDLLAITGCCVEATILNQFIYWSERIKDADEFIKKENEIAKRNGEEEKEPNYGWMYKSNQEMADEILMGYSAVQTGRYINKLVDKGFIQKRHNPKYKWDRTLQYKVNLVNIAKALKDKGYPLSDYKIELPENDDEENDDDSKKHERNNENTTRSIDNSSMNYGNTSNERAIPYITTETTDSDITFNNYNNDSEYASSLKDGGKNIYAFSEEKGQKKTDEDDEEEYKTIKEKLRYEVFPRIDDYIEGNYEYEYENGMNLVLEDIITEFYNQYFMKRAKEHRIMRPETYEKIVDRYFMPHEDMEDVYDFESYKSMIEYYFKTNYNKRGNYDGKIKLSIAHFFSENILRNLYHKIQC